MQVFAFTGLFCYIFFLGLFILSDSKQEDFQHGFGVGVMGTCIQQFVMVYFHDYGLPWRSTKKHKMAVGETRNITIKSNSTDLRPNWSNLQSARPETEVTRTIEKKSYSISRKPSAAATCHFSRRLWGCSPS